MDHTPGGSACLAVLLVLFFILALLLSCKRIFLKKRESKQVSSLHPETVDLSVRSSTSFLPSPADSTSEKAAFFVGFFGSPAWETSATNLFEKTRSPTSKLHMSFSSYHYSGSRRSRSSRTPLYEQFSSPSANASTGHTQQRSLSMSTVGDIHASYETIESEDPKQPHLVRSLTRPSLAHDCPLRITDIRRFSVPSVGRRDVNSFGHIKRTSSLKTLTSSFRLTSLVGSPSLRLVQTGKFNDLEHPLPLSPKQPSSNLASSRYKIGDPSDSRSEQQDQLKKKRRISHPYALAPSSFAHSSSSGMNRGTSNTQANHSPTSALKSLSPIILPLSPLFVPYPPATYKEGSDQQPISQFPLATHSRTISPKLKQKERRKPSVRSRRSPAVGPSPLRSMILPDPSVESKIAVKTSTSQIGSHNSNTTLDYSRLGLGFPASPTNTTHDTHSEVEALPNSEQLMSGSDSRTLSATMDEDPNALVGIIRELVEETDKWDGSLFKDKNFKAMIDDSKYVLKGVSNCGPTVVEDLFRRDEDKSCEIDLSLLGLDIFRSGGEAFLPGVENKGRLLGGDTIKPHMDSLWQGNLTEDQDLLPSE
ncbi:hypothetical protein H0H87_008291 [Tephrocybe sp. NHM501043]|nr:hypothetical protein H0H87_008291 [Tephrocybe sp. NHM501043]